MTTFAEWLTGALNRHIERHNAPPAEPFTYEPSELVLTPAAEVRPCWGCGHPAGFYAEHLPCWNTAGAPLPKAPWDRPEPISDGSTT